MNDLERRHDEVVEELARSYGANGYTVETNVDVGEGGGRLEVDLLARRADETVLLEVRLRTPYTSETRLRDFAELAHRKGWRFVIALADSKNVEEVELPSAEAVRAKLAEASGLDPRSDAATLVAWAVLEAAARVVLARSTERILRGKSPASLVQELASLGRLTREEERELLDFAARRNRLAHGFWMAGEGGADVRQVLAVAERLLAEDR